MRNRALHDALRDFALEAAALLVRATEGGGEIAFSLDAQAGSGGTLYRYRPLTDDFIAERWDELRALPGFEAAARALGTGARAYLRRRGEPGADAEPALRAMLERLYEDSTSFAFPEERFERVYAGLERALYAGTVRATVAAPVLGLRFEAARLELADDLALVDVALLAPAPAWLDGDEEAGAGSPTAYLVLERDIASDAPLPLGEARVRLASGLSALRLLETSGVAAAPLGFARAGDGAWQPFLFGEAARPHGPELVLGSDEAPRLRRLVEALEERRRPGPLSWALARFELGLSRSSEVEALSDHLLALRALLGHGPAGDPATIALRLAALRAGESDRRAVQRRVEAAFALEPFVIEGGVGAARGERYVQAVGRHGPQALVYELEDDVRWLLAGALCGELDADLAGAADDRLLRSGEAVDIRAARLPGRGGDENAGPCDGAEPEPEAEAVAESPTGEGGDGDAVEEEPLRFAARAATRGARSRSAPTGSPLAAFPGRGTRERRPAPEVEDVAEGELTLDLEDDAEGYSAPV